MSVTLAFDVYGTLIDTQGVMTILEKMVGNKAKDLSDTWRSKQLEYSFRRGLMQNYVEFSQCTRFALDYACRHHQVSLTAEQKQTLMEAYKTLPAFDDVKDTLHRLKEKGYRIFAFSNGTATGVATLLKSAGIDALFEGIVSVDDVKSFKPSPAVYSHFLRKTKALGSETWLISSNPFDVSGALSFGMQAVWIQRSPEAIFDPWDIQPTVVASSLLELDEKLTADHR